MQPPDGFLRPFLSCQAVGIPRNFAVDLPALAYEQLLDVVTDS